MWLATKKKASGCLTDREIDSNFCLRVNIQAAELGEEARKRQDKEKTEKDHWRHPAACSDGIGCVAHNFNTPGQVYFL